MSTVRRRADAQLAALAQTRGGTVALLAFLVLLSLVIRTRVLDTSFWIDEGLTVGISSYPLTEIPGVLRQDGSPPLYYLLLHGWMEAFGRGEAETHALSLVFALLAVPAALWAGSSIFGRTAGWICCALAALNPFLTLYAQETRMYALVGLLSILGTGAFVHAFVYGRRRWVPVFAAVLIALLYTHNWAFFFAAGAVAALVVVARELPRPRRQLVDAALAFGAAAVAYLPWLPTLLFQAQHTGAPWSRTPSLTGLVQGASAVSGRGPAIALLLVGGSGLVAVLRQGRRGERVAVTAILVLATSTLVAAWLYSQFSPAWANRYLAVVLGPVLLLAAVGLSRAGRLGVAALALVLALSMAYDASDRKSNVRALSAAIGDRLQPGDLVYSTHPEQVPVLAYYLPPGLRYATPLGPVRDPRVMDWRDVVERLRAARVERTLTPLLEALPTGRRLLLVLPVVEGDAGWEAVWTNLVRRRSDEWAAVVRRDPRFFSVATAPNLDIPVFKGVHATLYVKVRRSPAGESRTVRSD